jgi:hypothetical protein
VSGDVAVGLEASSDHVPVYLDLQVPAILDAIASLDFGTVIVGAPAPSNTLTVTNVAPAPCDDLDYTLAAPTGFTAPGSAYSLGSGQHFDHTISMETTTSGSHSDNLEVDSNDLDDPTWYVNLTGTVLDHAAPSLSLAGVVTADVLDLGSAAPGEHSDEVLPVYNYGYDSVQALLEVYDAQLVGGDGRFSIVGGFSPETVGAVGAEFDIAFDSGTAEWDSLYAATLTFSTRDESGVPGATDLDDLVVTLQAYVGQGAGTPEAEITVLALSPGRPNPFSESTSFALALPAPADVDVTIYHISGRRIATLSEGSLPAGEHLLTWDGRDSTGAPVASGIYFCRANVGTWREVRKLVVLR